MRATNSFSACVALLAAMAGACATAEPTPSSSAGVDPDRRAVRLTTSGCGWASGRTGSGIVFEDGLIVTAAHLVARSAMVEVTVAGSDPVAATIAAVDYERDLALLRASTAGLGNVSVAPISAEGPTSGWIVGGSSSGTVPFTIQRPARISIEEVLGTERHERLGYELQAATTSGDSGAGMYDEDNRLLGMVFATSGNDTVTWATASSEILTFLEAARGETAALACDVSASRLATP